MADRPPTVVPWNGRLNGTICSPSSRTLDGLAAAVPAVSPVANRATAAMVMLRLNMACSTYDRGEVLVAIE